MDRLKAWLRDEVLVATAASFAIFIIIDRVIERLAMIPDERLSDRTLAASAVAEHPVVLVGVVVTIALLARFGKGGVLLDWEELDRGNQLRWMAGVVVVVLAWRYATTGYDYVFDQWHAGDRILLVVAAAWVIWKPVFLPLFAFYVRLLEQPFRTVLDFPPGQNIDELLVLVIVALAAFAVFSMATGSTRSVGVLPVLASLVAAQFFVSGRAKLRLDWLENNELGNLALNGFHQGWLGTTDGSFSERLGDAMETWNTPLLVATLVLELVAVAAVVRRELLVAFLIGWIGFHVLTFAALGFSFLEWIVVEVLLLFLITGDDGRRWATPAFKLGPVILAVVAVAAGSRLYQPPSLAWLDGPAVYRYEITAVDERGERQPLKSRDFEPYDHIFAFGALDLGPAEPLAAGYGASDKLQLEILGEVGNLDELGQVEGVADLADRDETIDLLERFLATTHLDEPNLRRVQPPPHFWTGRDDADYDFDVPLQSLEVDRVTVLRVEDNTFRRREAVLIIDWNDGDPAVRQP